MKIIKLISAFVFSLMIFFSSTFSFLLKAEEVTGSYFVEKTLKGTGYQSTVYYGYNTFIESFQIFDIARSFCPTGNCNIDMNDGGGTFTCQWKSSGSSEYLQCNYGGTPDPTIPSISIRPNDGSNVYFSYRSVQRFYFKHSFTGSFEFKLATGQTTCPRSSNAHYDAFGTEGYCKYNVVDEDYLDVYTDSTRTLQYKSFSEFLNGKISPLLIPDDSLFDVTYLDLDYNTQNFPYKILDSSVRAYSLFGFGTDDNTLFTGDTMFDNYYPYLKSNSKATISIGPVGIYFVFMSNSGDDFSELFTAAEGFDDLTIKSVASSFLVNPATRFYHLSSNPHQLYHLTSNSAFVPIYIGTSYPPQEILDFLGIGNALSPENQESIDKNDSQNEELDNTIGNLDDVENGFQNDFDDNLGNIDTNIDLGSQFVSSANFVKQQFDRILLSNPFGQTLSFSLLIGLATLLLGKRL